MLLEGAEFDFFLVALAKAREGSGLTDGSKIAYGETRTIDEANATGSNLLSTKLLLELYPLDTIVLDAPLDLGSGSYRKKK